VVVEGGGGVDDSGRVGGEFFVVIFSMVAMRGQKIADVMAVAIVATTLN
jgi:hypothetical protein